MENNSEIYEVAQRCKDVFGEHVASPVMAQEPWFRSAQGDFNLWCAATNATSTRKSSLTHSLRYKANTRATICALIRALVDSVDTVYNTMVGRLHMLITYLVSTFDSDLSPSSTVKS